MTRHVYIATFVCLSFLITLVAPATSQSQDWGAMMERAAKAAAERAARNAADRALREAQRKSPTPEAPPPAPAADTTSAPPAKADISAAARSQVEPSAIPILLNPGETLPFTQRNLSAEQLSALRDTRNAWSKQEFPLGNQPCRWLPTNWRTNAYGATLPFSVAEIAAQRQVIQKVLDFIKTAPVHNPPVDYCPIATSVGPQPPSRNQGFLREGGGHAIGGSFMQGNWPVTDFYRDRPGGTLRFDEITHVIYSLNEISDDLGGVSADGYGPFQGEDDLGKFYSKPKPTGMLQGFEVYQTNTLVIPRNDAPVWRPVRVDRLLRWHIKVLVEDIAIAQRDAAYARQQLIEMDTPAAKANQEAIIQARAERHYGGASGLARARTGFEAELAETRAKLQSEGNTSLPTNRVFIFQARKKQAEDTLAQITPAQAAAGGCLITEERNQTKAMQIAQIGTPQCRFDIYEANPAYFDKTSPRQAVQLVFITRFQSNRPGDGPANQREINFFANGHSVWGLDWQKFRREVMGGR